MMWLSMVMTVALAQAPVADPEDVLVDAVVEQMDRAKSELAIGDAPAIYHLRAKLGLLDEVSVVGDLGGVLEAEAHPWAGMGVEVRLGEPGWDNTGFGGWQDGLRYGGLPAWPTGQAVRLESWRLFDRAYKDAVEQYSRKQAQAVRPDDHPGDYTLTGAVMARGENGAGASASLQALSTLAEQLSAPMATVPGVALGRVYVGHETGAVWVLDTEGTRVRRPISETTVRAVLRTQLDDGARLTTDRLWSTSVGAAVDASAMQADVAEMLAEVQAVAGAPKLEDEYVGPVVFEGEAAADLFRWVLLPQLEGTPPEIPFESFLGDIGARGTGARVNRRVLPRGWTVVDDPTAAPEHPGSYTHDWEGTPAQAVRMVEDGIVKRVLMSRVPRKEVGGTNGHGRGGLGQRAVGKPSITTVTPAKALPTRKLYKTALKAAASYGHDHVLVVRKLQHPALTTIDDDDAWMAMEPGVFPAPLAVVRLYADGREELVRGAAFTDVQRFVLRDLVAAGRGVVRDYLSAYDGDDTGLGPTQGTACRISAPAVVVGELEVVPSGSDPRKKRLLPPPDLTASQAR